MLSIYVLQSRQIIRTQLKSLFNKYPKNRFTLISSTTLHDQSAETTSSFHQRIGLKEFNFNNILAAVTASHQTPPLFVTNDEYCLRTVNQLNKHYGNPAHADEVLNYYIDKVAMKKKLERSGIRFPKFVFFPKDQTLTNEDIISRVTQQLNFPMVAKPTQESNNRGVAILNSIEELLSWMAQHKESDVEVEEYINGKLYHCNSTVINGKVHLYAVGEYLNPCIAFSMGKPIGSIFIPANDALYEQIRKFNEAVINQLGQLQNCIYHLEVFRKDNGELVFLEVAARAPGGMLSRAAEMALGFDLEQLNFNLQMDRNYQQPQASLINHSFWAWVPKQPGQVIHQTTIPLQSQHHWEWYVVPNQVISLSDSVNSPACGVIARDSSYEKLYADFCQLKNATLSVTSPLPFFDKKLPPNTQGIKHEPNHSARPA